MLRQSGQYPKVITPELEELMIFGEPIQTYYGTFRFLTYQEYMVNRTKLHLIQTCVLGFYYAIRQSLEDQGVPKSGREPVFKAMVQDKMTLFEFLKSDFEESVVKAQETGLPRQPSLLDSYADIIGLSMIENDNDIEYDAIFIYQYMQEEDFINIRNIIMRMNLLKEEKKMSPRLKVQQSFERERRLKAQNSEPAPTLETMVTSIVNSTSYKIHEVATLTAYQIFSLFFRIGSFQEYDASTLFASVGADLQIVSWSQNNNMLEHKESNLTGSEFNKRFGNLT